MDKKPSQAAEEMARKLQASLQRERPRWFRWLPLLAVIFCVVLLILGWLLYPVAPPPPLTVTAMDGLTALGEDAVWEAWLDPKAKTAEPVKRDKQEVFFWEDRAGAAPEPMAAEKCDAAGRARHDGGRPEKEGMIEFAVRHLGHERKSADENRARVFVVSPTTPLLLVDVEEGPAELAPELWGKTNPALIKARAGAIPALQGAESMKMQLVYLAMRGDEAKEYRRPRSWARLQLPPGPVLGRLVYDAAGRWTEATRARVLDLRGRFKGPILALAATAESAALFRAAEVRVIGVGEGPFPPEVSRAAAWQDVPRVIEGVLGKK